MKKVLCLTSCNLIIALYTFAINHIPVINSATEPRAVFEKITVDFKAAEGSESGMMLHIKFTVHDMKDIESTVAVFVMHNDYHRGYLKDTNQKYYSSSGEVAVYKNIKPTTAAELFEDLQIFMPYSEFDLFPGDYPLTMDIKLLKSQGGVISKLTAYDFNFTKPLPNSTIIPTASVDSIAIDHNISQNNKTGMRITVKKLSVSGTKNSEGYLAIYFEKKDRTKLKPISDQYKSQGGQTTVYQLLSMPYETSEWGSLSVFIPYEELGLGKGKFDLRLDADVLYKNGALLKHIRFHEFQVEL